MPVGLAYRRALDVVEIDFDNRLGDNPITELQFLHG
jgi:hypothetical protein